MLRQVYSTFFNCITPLLLFYNKCISRASARYKKERIAIPTKSKEGKKVIWFHGASLGEIMSLLPIISLTQARYPQCLILVTSASKHSGDLVASKLPKNTIHQFLPFDRQKYVKSFLRYWAPSLVIWVESDFWPNMLIEVAENNIPLILLNGRISRKSFLRWKGFPPLIKVVIKNFSLVFAQSHDDFKRLSSLGNKNIFYHGNIKFYAHPLPYKMEEIKTLHAAIGSRPFWLAASTHKGEENIVASAHLRLRKIFPDLLTILVPRHPNRREEIYSLLTQKGLSIALRSKKDCIKADTEIYIGDTLGELGLFYQLSPFAFLGGSLMKIGGHTPIEPALLDCAIISGPYVYTNASLFDEFKKNACITMVGDEDELVAAVNAFLQSKNTHLLQDQIKSAHILVKSHQEKQQELLEILFHEIDKS